MIYSVISSFFVNESLAISSIILVFFNDLFYKRYGHGIISDAVLKSASKDAADIKKFFTDDQQFKDFFLPYFEYGGDIFGLYAALMTSLISTAALFVRHYSNIIVIITWVTLTCTFIVLMCKIRGDTEAGDLNAYSENTIGGTWKVKDFKKSIVVSNLWIIILGELVQNKIL
jgi:hypothetical protein